MSSFNKIVIVGYLGKDPEIRYLPDSTAVCSFSVATTEKTKRGGDSQEQTTWFRVAVWGKQGEACSQYLAKGSQVYIEGRLSQNEYTDRDGNPRSSLEVRANDVQFLDRQPRGDGEARAASVSKGFSTDRDGRVVSPPMDDDSGIPF